MGRPVGTKDKTPRKRRDSPTLLPKLPPEQVLRIKVKILEQMVADAPTTLTSAARKLGIDPIKAHNWVQTDRGFGELVKMTREVVADQIEEEFWKHANFIPKMMVLKAYRPEFRDNYKVDLNNERLEELLKELREAKHEPAQDTPAVEVELAPELPEVITQGKQLALPLPESKES